MWCNIVLSLVSTLLFQAVVFLGLEDLQLHKDLAVVKKDNSRMHSMVSVFEHRLEKLEKVQHHTDDALLGKEQTVEKKEAKEASLIPSLAKKLKKEEKLTSKQDEKMMVTKFRRLNARIHRISEHFQAQLEKLRTEEKATLKQVARLRHKETQAYAARVLRRDLSKIKGWRWFQAAARDEAPLSQAIHRITSELSQAKQQGLSDSEVGSSKRVLSQLKHDKEELTLHRVPKNFAHHMTAAKVVMTFLKEAAHPHVLHHGYIYATMDFANPFGDDDGGPPANGHQQKFLSLPHGWQLAPGTKDSRTVTINNGWNTDCLTFSDGTSWQTSDGSYTGSCGKHTLFSNKKKQYRPAQGSDHSRRILIRFPVPK